MTTLEVHYPGALRLLARHAESGAELPLAVPEHDGGPGGAFSPTDLVATALASCLLSVIGLVARRHAWPVEGARAVVDKQLGPGSRIEALGVTLHMPEALTSEARTRLERAAQGCPVHRALDASIAQRIEFVWPEPG